MAEPYFKRTFKGYDPEEVDKFIIGLSDKYASGEKEFEEQIRALKDELDSARGEIKRLEEEAEAEAERHAEELAKQKKGYEELCTQVGENMVTADRRAEAIVRAAEREAEAIKNKAKSEAEVEAKAIRRRAESEAEKLINDTSRRCEALTLAAEDFRRRQSEMQRSISETERQFGDALNRLRDGINITEENR